MDWEKYYFKLEIEQLPEHIWTKLKNSSIVQQLKFKDKSEIIQEIDHLPEPILDKLRQTTKLIWHEFIQEFVAQKIKEDEYFSAEEDEAWKDL